MVVVQASKLSLPNPSLSPNNNISSLIFEPTSSSLALTFSDASISLYPSLSSLSSSPSLPPPKTLIPSPSSSSTFLLLQAQNPNSLDGFLPRVLFVVAGPIRGGSKVFLRFFALVKEKKGFVRVQVVCDQKGIESDGKVGVLLDLQHGISVRIVGSTNYFVMHSVSSSKVSVYGVKLVGNGGGDGGVVVVKLVRCAVIECCRPVWSMSVFSGFLLLGEENGVRVLSLRELVKGKMKKGKSKVSLNGKLENKRPRSANGTVRDEVCDGGLTLETACDGYLDNRNERRAVRMKQRVGKYRLESPEAGSSFVAFKEKEANNQMMKASVFTSVKAISIQAMSPKRFLILDSAGDLHILHVSHTALGSNITCQMRQLPHFMEVQKLAVLPETSAGTQTVWISDGDYSVHRVNLCDEDNGIKDEDKSDKNLMQASVAQVIFSPEKIQGIVPIAGNGILILGLGSLYAYDIS